MYLAASSLIVEQPRNYLANTIINLKIIKIILHKKEKQKKKEEATLQREYRHISIRK